MGVVLTSRRWELLYLSQEDVVRAGGTRMRGTIQAVERSFFLHGVGDYVMPPKPVIRWGGPETEETIGRVMSMPAYLGGSRYAEELSRRGLLGPVEACGMKFIPSRPSNPSRFGLPRASALVVILDSETLIPRCVMDGAIVSAMRTGAASAVAARYLARPGSRVLGLVGASVQGRTQLAALRCVLPELSLCKVFDLDAGRRESFAREMSDLVGLEVRAVSSPEEAIRGSDVVVTATTASEPYVDPSWYADGVLHVEISFWDTPVEALRVFDRIFVDDWSQVSHHGVDVSYRAVARGILGEERISGELGEVVVGRKPGRTSDEERIFFNPIGLGIHDLSEAHRVMLEAERLGVGRRLVLFEDPDAWLRRISLD